MRKTNGITLIALVITIIVLIILAGISIATLTGENGILTKADVAKEKATIAEESEIIKLAYTNNLTENTTDGTEITINNLQKEINKSKTASVEEVNEIPEEAIVIDNGVSSGTICKITMEYVYYMYLKNTEDSTMKKFFIEFYDSWETKKLVETITLYYKDEEYFDEWLYSKYNTQLTDVHRTESMRGDLLEYNYYFSYNENLGGDFTIYMDATGTFRQDLEKWQLFEGVTFKFY